MRFTQYLVAAALLACGVARAAVPVTGAGTAGASNWEQLRFYGPGGGVSTTYPSGQPRQLASVLDENDQLVPSLCSGGSDICGSKLVFQTQNAGSVTAFASTQAGGTTAIVRQDLSPDYGGLGVQGYRPQTRSATWQWKSGIRPKHQIAANIGRTKYGSYPITRAAFFGNDEINDGDQLTLTFAKAVQVVGFHFFDANHQQRLLTGDFFGLSIDNRPLVNYPFLGGYPFYGAASTLTGTKFTFSLAANDPRPDHFSRPDNYYLGAIKFAPAVMTPVPEPQTLALMLAGLTVLGSLRIKWPRGLHAVRRWLPVRAPKLKSRGVQAAGLNSS